MIFNVPDKDTVQALADEYGLTLQTGEYDGKTVEYYEFPVDWAPNGSDKLPSGTTMVDVKRFNYLNGEGVTGEDIFDEMVGLKDGAIRVIMNDVAETTETTTATTTTTTTATTTTQPQPLRQRLLPQKNRRLQLLQRLRLSPPQLQQPLQQRLLLQPPLPKNLL